jgi:hypothetical protein
MKNPLFNKKHILEYLFYGGMAAIVFIVPVIYFLAKGVYEDSWVVYVGTALFMFAIMVYNLILTRRKADYKSALKMLMAGHLAVLTGIVLSVLLAFICCYIYIPGFMTGHSQPILDNAPEGLNNKNTGTLLQIFLPATIGNFCAGAFITVVVSYVIKPNQTKDKAAPL